MRYLVLAILLSLPAGCTPEVHVIVQAPTPAAVEQTPPAVVVTPTPGPGPDTEPPAVVAPTSKLVFSDEFDGTTLDRSKWCTRYMFGGGPAKQEDSKCWPAGRSGEGNLDFLNDEQQRYVDKNSRGELMHVVKDGVLTLRATKDYPNNSWVKYYSSMIRTNNDHLLRPNGKTLRIETRWQLPAVRGTWPALWLAVGSAKWPPEIDIVDSPYNSDVPNNASTGQWTIGPNALHSGVIGSFTPSKNLYADTNFRVAHGNYVHNTSLHDRWIVSEAEWTDSQVCMFLTAAPELPRTKVSCEAYEWKHKEGGLADPATLIINLAMGGSWAGTPTADEAKTLVDYVRVYEDN